MQRELKFRVWNTRIKKMFCPEKQGMALTGLGKILEWCRPGPIGGEWSWKEIPSEIQEELVVQRFTGLLDKNKKEIYEGDILQEKYQSVDKIGEVFYNPGAFLCIDKRYNSTISTYNAVIIGNIFENSELIK